MKFHPSDVIPAHKLHTGVNKEHRHLLAAARLHKMKTPGKRPAKVENVEKSAFTNTNMLKLAIGPASPQPFFPGGKPVYSLPDTTALDAQLRSGPLSPQPALHIKPRDVIAPYYQNSGGIALARQKAEVANKNYSPSRISPANIGMTPPPHAWTRKLWEQNSPGKVDLRNLDRDIPIRAGVEPTWNMKTQRLTLPAVLGGDYSSLRGAGASRGGMTSGFNQGKSPEKLLNARYFFQTPYKPDAPVYHLSHFANATADRETPLPDILRHEINHSVNGNAVGKLDLLDDSRSLSVNGYFALDREHDQGLASTKQETAALTGRLIDTPKEYDNLIKEINPTDSDEAAFEKRIAPYSAEGQRYFRFMRMNARDPEYYQQILRRGRERMPLMVQNTNAENIEKTASWLERYLSMFAARDAAHQADPAKDALGTKLLGGPLSMGLSEAINNRAILGNTPEQREESMHEAADEVKQESYTDSVLRGLKSSPAYIGIGAAAGAGIPALTDRFHGRPVDAGKLLGGAGIGAAGGLGLAVLRPLIQRAVLGNVSNKALRKAIETKANNPTLTALPLGDVIGAMKS
jgi:hypothetical protein